MNWVYPLSAMVAGYLLGSVPFGFLIGLARGKDIRRSGSGNIGATNVWRIVGKAEGLAAFLLDVGKGLVSVLVIAPVFCRLAPEMMTVTKIAAGLGVILGHVFPVYLKFRGGKAVATSLGVLVSLVWLPVVIALGVFIVVVAVWRYISLGSISAAVVLVVAQALSPESFGKNLLLTIFCFVVALLVVIRHRSNIRKLLAGTENAFDISGK